jgi:tetratricopeptide (TPR) repeat protein
VLLLIGAECALRLARWGYPTSFCLRQDGGRTYTDNPKFLWQFYSRKTDLRPTPFAVGAAKPPGTARIVILGESAAAGTPEPAFGFARILERMLRDQFPQQHIQVINAAMRGVNSHVLLPVARDCARLEPDLFLVYLGNNEAVGLYAPGPGSGLLTAHRRLLRAVQWLRSTRLGELLEAPLQRLSQPRVLAGQQDAAFFAAHRLAHDDPRRQAVYDSFRANLNELCQLARTSGAGVGVVLATVAANLKDCPPFGSLHRPGLSEAERTRWEGLYAAGIQASATGHPALALSNFLAAAALDDHHAELHFRLATACAALDRFDQAQLEFTLARERDALPFRADARLNAIIRQVAAEAPAGSVQFVDVEQAFAASAVSDHQIPGERLFHDHVHLTFDGDYLVARTLLPAVVEALAAKAAVPVPAKPALSREDSAARLAFTRLGEARIAAAMMKVTSHPPFTSQADHAQRQAAAEHRLAERFGDLNASDVQTARRTFQEALLRAPEDWQLHSGLARLLLSVGDARGAIEQFQAARRLLPHALPIRLGLSNALSMAGRHEEALEELDQALALDPGSESLKAARTAVQTLRRK